MAFDFCKEVNGFATLANLLSTQCLRSTQIAYNVICALWILSYQDAGKKCFISEDFNTNIIANIVKILDYFNKENIVRIMLMLLDNLKTDSNCLELMSLCDCNHIIIKLQKKPWVDTEIEPLLEKLQEYY
jgi:hypothetical protein